MTSTISPERFHQIVATYGASPSRWPEPERHAALEMASSPEHQALLAAAAQLDDLLAEHQVQIEGASLIHRIAATAPTGIPWRRWSEWWLPGTAIVGTALAGMAAGVLLLPIAVEVVVAPRGADYPLVSGFWDESDVL